MKQTDLGESPYSGPILDMKRIRQFMVLAQTLNFRRAAERLHMAQPPLTVSIQKLESDLGVRLFERGGAGGVTLTVAGQAALVEARRLLFHNSQLIATVQATAAGTGGCLRIGFVGSTTHGVLQRIVRQFRADFPAVQLVLKEATSVQIADRVERGELDVGLVRTPLMASAQVRLKPLLTERFVAAVPLGNALTAHAELRMDMLAGEPFVFYTRGDAAGLQAMAMLACQQAGFLPRIAQEATQVQTVLSLVESGLGVALVPSIMQNSPNPGVAYRAIHDIAPAADIGLALLVPEMANPAVPGFQEAALKCFAVG